MSKLMKSLINDDLRQGDHEAVVRNFGAAKKPSGTIAYFENEGRTLRKVE